MHATLACLLACELRSFHLECVRERTKSMWAGEAGMPLTMDVVAEPSSNKFRSVCHKSEITQPTVDVEEFFLMILGANGSSSTHACFAGRLSRGTPPHDHMSLGVIDRGIN
jgi:hypothetical protein